MRLSLNQEDKRGRDTRPYTRPMAMESVGKGLETMTIYMSAAWRMRMHHDQSSNTDSEVRAVTHSLHAGPYANQYMHGKGRSGGYCFDHVSNAAMMATMVAMVRQRQLLQRI